MKKNIKNKKILLVEDDKDFLLILRTKLTMAGFNVVAAHDGQEGFSMVGKEKPDLIVSDVLMPIMDGIEMAVKIKESNKKAKILFLTNIQDADYTKKLEDSKEFDYLIKSEMRINEIVEKIKAKL
jgi:DNA-binding response OmpR family regulator